MPCNKALKIRQLSYSVSHKQLLNNIDLIAECGQSTAIIGPNGAGKSTLLKAVSGAICCTASEMEFCDKNLKQWKVDQRACSVAVLSQENSLEFPFSCEEVVAMGRIPHSSGKLKDRAVVQAVMALMDITHLQRRLYTQLSGGEKQRTQLARVFAQLWPDREDDSSPRLLLLDEPTAYLDLGHQQQLMNVIRDFATANTAVLMVLHDVNLAAQYADKVVVLNEGIRIAEGKAGEVLNERLLSELFAADLKTFHHPETNRPFVYI
ncbi:iron complex transport system ATP-binding protein [Alteromonadaceae bacterium Bs31]|nr:iron complex transport system ATP-binding protein [Alteromonadaceae bacterium Bs31]